MTARGFYLLLFGSLMLFTALSVGSSGAFLLGAAALGGFYLWDSSAFAGLLPDVLGRFSLLDAFNNFAVGHVFDIPGLLLYLSLIALLVFAALAISVHVTGSTSPSSPSAPTSSRKSSLRSSSRIRPS